MPFLRQADVQGGTSLSPRPARRTLRLASGRAFSNKAQPKELAMPSPDPILVRPASVTDIPAIRAIYDDAVLTGTASFELEPPSIDDMQARWHSIAGKGFPYLVAEMDGQVAGYAYAAPYHARPAYRGTVENSIYLRSDCRGRGLGRTLLAALVDRATDAGFRQMIAVIGDSANAASIGLHRSLGFEFTGTLRSVGWKHGRWLDCVLMQRALGAGDADPLQD
jgi:L-amino acid N-acyltransferase YncA